ncbi:PilZ domain-containing protein [Thioflavicoccus mobilis 8321]|uniref:PilZ domain-containing protein n=1 Tax=Thioflavicoccus mobilis 8321 TaxID=765912 RepID=L0GXE1_9GAMM|nr:PilZ domain-containing protein [Thioflavicoccus mobilis]AGA90035.1 PilZ domain-containing protein [Thioflavicoccus mobilis 8321]
MESSKKRITKVLDKRYHPRLSVTIPISIEIDDAGTVITVENLDISWGGIRFAVPRDRMPSCKQVKVRFPWANGRHFSVDAEILRVEPLDERRDAIAARFFSVSTQDQRRLDKLLEMLHGTDKGSGQSTSLVPVLEVLISDEDEVRTKLAELAAGQLTVTVFETYETNQSIRLLLDGIPDQPPLRLRARIVEIATAPTGEDSAWAMFNLKLQFEHPLDELIAVSRSLTPRRRK